jgi:hypothetical protein
MEGKDEGKKEENSPAPKISQPNQTESDDLNNKNIYDQYQSENIQLNKEPEKNTENQKQKEDSQPNNQNASNNHIINIGGGEKKRHRRGKNEINERNFRCPDCGKCYLSGPALTTHRKTKHGYGNSGERRNRGRPPKKDGIESQQNNQEYKFKNFFNDEKRKPMSLDQPENDKIITIEIIKEFLEKIFKQCKNEIFKDFDTVEKYSFYKLILENWDVENPFPSPECLSAISIGETSNKIQSYSLDELFFLYLKKFSKSTNKEYFWFMIKYVVLFRECINSLRESIVTKEVQSENKKLYTEIYNAETVPEMCNDFFVDFMERFNFFGLNKDELIELVQHFCYWLYSNHYTQSHLTLLEN